MLTTSKLSSSASFRTSWGALILSLSLHASLLFLVGGFVVFKGVIPQTPFLPVPGQALTGDLETMPEPPTAEDVLMPDSLALSTGMDQSPNLPAGGDDAVSSDILVSHTAPGIASFTLPPPSAVPTSGLPRLGSASTAASTDHPGGSSPAAQNVVRTLFGSSDASTPAFIGRFYDLSRNAKGGPPPRPPHEAPRLFVQERGRASALRDFWISPTTLHAPHIAIPQALTRTAFESFGEKAVTPNPGFLVHYTARLAATETITFRLNAMGNDCVLVLVNGRLVVAADPGWSEDGRSNITEKRTRERFGWESPQDLLFPFSPSYNRYTIGDWMTWNAGAEQRVDILVGDWSGGMDAYIFVEEQGRRHKKLDSSIPVLPLFRVARTRPDEHVLSKLRPLEYEDKGPVFQVLH